MVTKLRSFNNILGYSFCILCSLDPLVTSWYHITAVCHCFGIDRFVPMSNDHLAGDGVARTSANNVTCLNLKRN